jgi:class 3 adenylate cyclase
VTQLDLNLEEQPLDTQSTRLPPELLELTELLARHAHYIWGRQRLADGWRWGHVRSDDRREHPCLVPYEQLPESEKQYDRNAALETLKAILALGYKIEANPSAGAGSRDSSAAGDNTAADARAAMSELLARLVAAEQAAKADSKLAQAEKRAILDAWVRRHEPTEAPAWSGGPELYRHAARRLLKLGEPPLAREIAEAGREFERSLAGGITIRPWENDPELRRWQGLALARTASPEAAQVLLSKLHAEGKADAEAIGILARAHKDLGLLAVDEAGRQQNFARSYGLYREVYDAQPSNYWHGVNAAAISLLRGDRETSKTLAEQLAESCGKQLQTGGEAAGNDYWLLATLGEVELLRGRFEESAVYYSRAYQVGAKNFGDLNSTRRQARLLLTALNRDEGWIDDLLPMPRVVVFTGHMFDSPGRTQPRFPASAGPAVYRAIKQWLIDQRGLIGYSSAACGGDLLFLRALREIGGESHVVLPFGREEFAQQSVSFAGPEAVREFEEALQAAAQVVTISPHRADNDGLAYDYANLVLHGLASVESTLKQSQLLGLAVWNGASDGAQGGAFDCLARWRSLEVPVSAVLLSPDSLANQSPLQVRNVNDLVTAAPSQATDSLGYQPTSKTASGTRLAAMLFADAAGYSSLSETQMSRFLNQFLQPIAAILRRYQGCSVKNTWGDGLYCVFDTVRDAGCFALDISNFVSSTDWSKHDLPATLALRIALHAGPAFFSCDPITGHMNCTGSHVSRAARLEPKTPKDQVYASEAFAALAAVDRVSEFSCEYVKQLDWAKHYGSFPTYLLRDRRTARRRTFG